MYYEKEHSTPLGHPNHVPTEYYRKGFMDGYHGRTPTIPQEKEAAAAYMQGYAQGKAARGVS